MPAKPFIGYCDNVAGGEVHLYGVLFYALAPGVSESGPVVGVFFLEAVNDGLLEQSVLVADSVAGQRELHGSRAVEEACCETSQTAVAEGGVLYFLEVAQGGSRGVHQLFGFIEQSQAHQVVVYRAPYQELRGEVACGAPFWSGLLHKRSSLLHYGARERVVELRSGGLLTAGELGQVFVKIFFQQILVYHSYLLFQPLMRVFRIFQL